jgi:hypothetical protein
MIVVEHPYGHANEAELHCSGMAMVPVQNRQRLVLDTNGLRPGLTCDDERDYRTDLLGTECLRWA